MTPEQLEEAHKQLKIFKHLESIVNQLLKAEKSKVSVLVELKDIPPRRENYDLPISTSELIDILTDKAVGIRNDLQRDGVEITQTIFACIASDGPQI